MAAPPDRRLRAAVVPVLDRFGYDLEDLSVSAAGRRSVVRVVIDRDGGFGLDDVADVSRELSSALDDDDSLPGAYVLEVSSPGVDRPLTQPRHWRRNVGRLVQVRLLGGETVTGRIQSAGEDHSVLDVSGAQRSIPYGEVERARVQVELRPSGPTTSPAEQGEPADLGDESDDDLSDDLADEGDDLGAERDDDLAAEQDDQARQSGANADAVGSDARGG